MTLESVAFGGDALARLDGKVYFVADAIPGETVEALVLQDKERFAKARVLRRLQAAPEAIPAPCPFADRCGGCQWQTVPYAKQLTWKAGFIQDALQRIGGIPADSYAFTMQGSIEPLHYRNRIEIKWQVRDQHAGLVWFHGEDADLHIWLSEEEGVSAWQLIADDHVVEWSSVHGIKTGGIKRASRTELGILEPGEAYKVMDEEADAARVRLATDVIAALPFPERNDLAKTLEELAS